MRLVPCVVGLAIVAFTAMPGLSAFAQAHSGPHDVAPLPAQPLMGQLGGTTYTTAISGHYAYVAAGPRLTVVDVSDRSHPTTVAESSPLLGIVMGIAVAGNYAYVATQGGLNVLDLSDPLAPRTVGSRNGGGYHWVAVQGSFAYVAAGTDGLRVFDITNPAQPTEVGSLATSGFSESVILDGHYAYVADHATGLRIVDVSQPTSPAEVGSFDTPGDVWYVQVAGRYAYVADHQRGATFNGGLLILDVLDHAHPVEVGSLIYGDGTHGLSLIGSSVLIARDSGFMDVIDASDVSNPIQVGEYALTATADEALKVILDADNVAYVTTAQGQLHIVDVTNRQHPTGVAIWNQPGTPAAVAVSGNLGLLASLGRGLRVIDLANPTRPAEIGQVPIPGATVSVAIDGHYAYVTSGFPFPQLNQTGFQRRLSIVDISNPVAPVTVGSCVTTGYAQSVVVAGHYAYVAAYEAGLQVIDVADAAHPTVVATHGLPGLAEAVAVSSHFAFVADGSAGLRILDVSNPLQPVDLGAYDTPGYARALTIAGSYAYVADSNGGLRIIDISAPSQPFEVSAIAANGTTVGVDVSAAVAYLADYFGGLRVVDVSNPASPQETQHLTFSAFQQYARGVTVRDSTTFLAAMDGGLVVLRTLDVPPVVATGTGVNRPRGTVTLNGAVNPNGLSTSSFFDFGLSTVYANRLPTTTSPATNMLLQSVSVVVSGLTCGRTYHFRVIATNGAGTTLGTDASFVACSRSRVDFDGDARSEVAVYRPASGNWFIRNSTLGYAIGAGTSSLQWGAPGDVPQPGDYDADGKTDVTVYRPSTGQWFIRYSSRNYDPAQFGYFEWGSSGDIPIPSDFDGDGRTDIGVYRPSTGDWFLRLSTAGYVVGAGMWSFQWGAAGDVPKLSDFDGDGQTDVAVYRPSTGQWFIRYSSRGYDSSLFGYFAWGALGDVSIAADFDGDGLADIGVYRPSAGFWFLRLSSQNFAIGTGNWVFQWGAPGDLPLDGDFDGDGRTDIAVYRSSAGVWFVRYSSLGWDPGLYGYFAWGTSSDTVLTR